MVKLLRMQSPHCFCHKREKHFKKLRNFNIRSQIRLLTIIITMLFQFVFFIIPILSNQSLNNVQMTFRIVERKKIPPYQSYKLSLRYSLLTVSNIIYKFLLIRLKFNIKSLQNFQPPNFVQNSNLRLKLEKSKYTCTLAKKRENTKLSKKRTSRALRFLMAHCLPKMFCDFPSTA